MGFIANAISSLFGGGGGETQVVKVPEVTTTARDLVSETSSQEVESPTMGSNKTTKKKNRGISSLIVNRDNTGGSGGTGINL